MERHSGCRAPGGQRRTRTMDEPRSQEGHPHAPLEQTNRPPEKQTPPPTLHRPQHHRGRMPATHTRPPAASPSTNHDTRPHQQAAPHRDIPRLHRDVQHHTRPPCSRRPMRGDEMGSRMGHETTARQ
ncbi:hypothetical protein LDENG_00090980, partial [Lucifuga dentata]